MASRQEQKLDIESKLPHVEKYSIWEGWGTDAETLQNKAETGSEIRRGISELVSLTDDPAEVLIPVKKWFIDGREFLEGSKIFAIAKTYSKTIETFLSVNDDLEQLGIPVDKKESLQTVSNSLGNINANANKLKNWCEWQSAKEQTLSVNLEILCSGLENGLVNHEELSQQFRSAFCYWLAPLLIDEEHELRQFKASTHEQTIESFRELDERVAEITSDYIVALASESKPVKGAKDNPNEFGVLAKELQKKTRHIPIRALINQIGDSLLDLCPCLMMSPLSVAQFLPSDFKGFDLVVFDEASQMTTWDSVGAIARGKNVIIVGDPKQMPPTNFFSAGGNSEDPDEEDLESILDQALAARLPLKRLMGHYRSKHETLIAFSNSKYYENSLVTYPSSETKESAVSLHRVNGIYAKGKGRNNTVEAQAVVDEIVRRLLGKQEHNKSIGVVTLNTDQQRTIEDLLDDARRQHPSIEKYFQDSQSRDSVFVKNLESVQGDERDVIMLSLAYGPTEPEAKTMSMNFGPLNKGGGERRLNVAITRATTEVVVFSSFDSSMIDLSRTNSVAVEHLKHFLEFAEKGPIALAEIASADHGVDQFDSDLEEAVAQALRVKGWKIQTQVGVSRFRVDLGVLHPDRPGKYIAGVECDGATYHGSPTARDRDRVRQIILESLGWNIVRLWSTDYFVDPESAIDKVDMKLREILVKERELSTPSEAIVLGENVNDGVAVEDLSEVAESEALKSKALNADDYFEPQHKELLTSLVKEVLSERPGITLHSLALEIANLHGLTRTSKKQIEYLCKVVEQFAGINCNDGYSPTLWQSPEDRVDLIEWRGVDTFGFERKWSELAYEEALGLAKFAITKSSDSPIDVMCDELRLKRRHETTLSKFNQWISEISDRVL
ncbi:AAA domain-containing protein [Paraglaciecola aquimarina]|uniref:AAA domain-containing protein n=1 Tax=Paraglaciecola aquimarina TaxID=1235557 RepID=A0ABU3SSF1_9ALTE|nr:AAA domain-containing protein [Paraglaciecola aquimarina]MDU0352943.1 AAA domain-containing protein [Paraglaciecola aquimarina]